MINNDQQEYLTEMHCEDLDYIFSQDDNDHFGQIETDKKFSYRDFQKS